MRGAVLGGCRRWGWGGVGGRGALGRFFSLPGDDDDDVMSSSSSLRFPRRYVDRPTRPLASSIGRARPFTTFTAAAGHTRPTLYHASKQESFLSPRNRIRNRNPNPNRNRNPMRIKQRQPNTCTYDTITTSFLLSLRSALLPPSVLYSRPRFRYYRRFVIIAIALLLYPPLRPNDDDERRPTNERPRNVLMSLPARLPYPPTPPPYPIYQVITLTSSPYYTATYIRTYIPHTTPYILSLLLVLFCSCLLPCFVFVFGFIFVVLSYPPHSHSHSSHSSHPHPPQLAQAYSDVAPAPAPAFVRCHSHPTCSLVDGCLSVAALRARPCSSILEADSARTRTLLTRVRVLVPIPVVFFHLSRWVLGWLSTAFLFV
ncbi:hypothetical protein B0H16DRAFT_514866 [Mycena metata]|uniref:Uncharacterized protein n=1 Tax=Mycena metata TaxID=1033252 RepID=A0AAD7NHH7_9AGAR|nr:hypothetical protein B0H16DRAFT_514866 [Mycena metata]